ncbi:MAG: PilT protein domain protein [Microgenomates group bacterium GW2011_GWA2_46_16]|nr:MAG: PilT protein domain protein [Microgenomates group bacterium GW2011_GWA2_46_16]
MIIIDASVAVKWLIPGEQQESQAFTLMDNHVTNKQQIIVPDLFFYELGNTLATKTSFPGDKILSSLNKIYSLNLVIKHPDPKLTIKAAQLAKKYETSVYDMLYAVVAKRNKCKLVTADRKFIEKTKFTHVVHISEYAS